MKRQALVDSSARSVRPRVHDHIINRRLGTTVSGTYLPPDITDQINAYVGPQDPDFRRYVRDAEADLVESHIANIQGFPQPEQSAGLLGPSYDFRSHPHVYDTLSAIQPEGPFTSQASVRSPPQSRGPGGRRR